MYHFKQFTMTPESVAEASPSTAQQSNELYFFFKLQAPKVSETYVRLYRIAHRIR